MVTIFNYIFTGIFCLEAVMKMVAYGKRYFYERWNVFDFIIVIGSLAGILVGQVTSSQIGPQATIMRSFRITRILRLMQKNRHLQQIFNTFIVTIPAMANVGGLMMLFVFIYSVMGLYLFAEIKISESLQGRFDFVNFINSFTTLLQLITVQYYFDLFKAYTQSRSILYQCNPNPTY